MCSLMIGVRACLLFDHIRSKHYEERKMFEGDAVIVEKREKKEKKSASCSVDA